MQLLGIGFPTHDWNTLIKQLHINVSHQLNAKLYEVTNSASETKIWLKDTENLSAGILNQNPDWLLFSPRKFKSVENCLDLLENIKRESTKKVSLVMVIQSLQEDINSILTFNPIYVKTAWASTTLIHFCRIMTLLKH